MSENTFPSELIRNAKYNAAKLGIPMYVYHNGREFVVTHLQPSRFRSHWIATPNRRLGSWQKPDRCTDDVKIEYTFE